MGVLVSPHLALSTHAHKVSIFQSASLHVILDYISDTVLPDRVQLPTSPVFLSRSPFLSLPLSPLSLTCLSLCLSVIQWLLLSAREEEGAVQRDPLSRVGNSG